MNILNPLRLTLRLQENLVALADLQEKGFLSGHNARLTVEQMERDAITLSMWLGEIREKLAPTP